MPKVLSKSGASLADVYDVEGSVAGVEEVLTKDVQLIHEMGGVIVSERFRTRVLRVASGDIDQNTNFDTLLNINTASPTPLVPNRLLGVVVVVDTAARLSRLQVSARDPDAGEDFPIWVFAGATDHTIRIRIAGGAAADMTILTPDNLNTPSMLGGSAVSHRPTTHELVMRGRTSGFGAGTVEMTLLAYVAFPRPGGVNSTGLPIPSW